MEQQRSALESFIPNLKISILINQMTKMSKHGTIECDLSQVLDEFLQKLNECGKYLENGIFKMNFAEAALLLQSSADLYGKKVDLLWDIIFDYQKRILLSDEQNANKDQEIEKLEERKRKYKRKHKTHENESRTTKLVHNFSFGNVESFDYLNQNYERVALLKEWEKFHIEKHVSNDNHRGQGLNKNFLFLPNNAVYTEDKEYIGRYDQFHSASIIEEIFHLEKEKLLQDEHNCVTKMRIDCYVINDFLLEKSIPPNKPQESYVNELNQYITHFVKDKQIKDINLSYNSLQQSCCKESFVTLERLPFNLIQEKLRRISQADSLFDDDHMSYVSENYTDDPTSGNCDNEVTESEDIEVAVHMSFDQVAGSLEKRNKSCSQDSAFYELEDTDEQTDKPSVVKSAIMNNQLCCGGSSIVVTRQSRLIKRKAFLENLRAEDFHDEVKKRKILKKRVSEKVLKKLATGISFNLRDFEKFCRLQYKPADNEGVVPDLSDSESDDSVEEESDQDDFMEPGPDPFIETEVLSEEESTENQAPVLLYPPVEEISRRIIGPSQPTLEELEAEEVSRKNVREWRSFILSKVKTLENRADFDIHEYGARIIEPMKIGEERSFNSIVSGKSTTEVVRFFVATLQLANTNNVEITGAVPGRVANETFQVKTVDKTKYHELLEEYQAPSEETFRERLERAKLLNPKVPLHSTPVMSPVKKIKLADYSRKKLF